MPQVPADPLAWGAPAGATEILERRRKNVKVFQHAGNPGRTTSVFGGTIHYESTPGGGAWEDCDRILRTVGTTFVADHLPFSVTLNGRNLDLVDRYTGKGIRYVLPAVGTTVSGNTISFTWNGADWTYTVTGVGVKIAAVVASSRGNQHYQFPYARLGGAGTLSVLPDGSVQGDGYRLPAPVVFGADGARYTVGAWTVQATSLDFDWDDTALPPAAYPYVLDPATTFNVTASGGDGRAFRDNVGDTTYPPGGATNADTTSTIDGAARQIVSGGYRIFVGLTGWDTSSLSDTATVVGALARIYVNSRDDTDGRSIQIEYYDFGTIDTADYTATASGTAHAGTPLASITASADNDFPLADVDANISKTGTTRLRWHVSGGQPTGLNGIGYASFDHASLTEPRLIVVTDETTARPVGDVSAGTWTTAPLYDKIDETSASDADSIQSASAPSSDTAEIRLWPLGATNGTEQHILRVRRRKDATGGAGIDLTVSLRRGSSEQLDTQTLSAIDNTWTTVERALAFAGVRDDLRVRLVATTNGGSTPYNAPTFVAAGTSAFTATSGATLSPGLPSGWAADDIHVLFAARGDNTAMTSLSGWTQIASLSGDNTAAFRVETWWRRAVGGDTAPTVTFGTGTVVRGARIFGVRGCPTGSTPFDTQSLSANAASATVTFATITPTADNTLLLALFGYEDDPNNASTMTDWGAFTVAGSTLGNDMDIGHATRTYPTGGVATGSLTTTVSGGSFANSVNTGVLIAFVGSVPADRRAQVSWIELQSLGPGPELVGRPYGQHGASQMTQLLSQ